MTTPLRIGRAAPRVEEILLFINPGILAFATRRGGHEDPPYDVGKLR